MTNAEKFEEVFGFKANTKLCYMPEDISCPLHEDCDDCPYSKWLEEEYIGEISTQAESEDKE